MGGNGTKGPQNIKKKEKIQKPTGEFKGVNILSFDSGSDFDKVKGVGVVVNAGEGRNQIPSLRQ